MDHVRESGASINRRRRRRRAAITLTLVALLMLGTFAYAAAYFTGLVGNRVITPVASPSPTCRPATTAVKAALAPKAVTINVYNATFRAGLAASAARSLRAQGFKVARVANDPLGKSITGVGEIRHGKLGKASAALTAKRIPGAKLVTDKRTDATIDLVLGNNFKALVTPPKVTVVKATTPPRSPSC